MLKSWTLKPNSFLEAAVHTALEKAVGDISQLDTIGFKRFILKTSSSNASMIARFYLLAQAWEPLINS